jgi:putative membrane protein
MTTEKSWPSIALIFATAVDLRAHGPDALRGPWWQQWEWEPAIVITMLVAGLGYYLGLSNLRVAVATPGKLRREAWCYGAGWTCLVVALLSPLHPFGQEFFSVHMVQHEVLMVAAAPLLILGRPMLVMLSALPHATARRGVELLRRHGGRHAWHGLTDPFIAWLVHAAALWIWHIPALFEATIESKALHALQHVSFLGSALLFWHAVFFGPRRKSGYGMAVVYLFTTALHSGALGALLTFATVHWYPAYASGAGIAGLTSLEDQQLGGLIMWIPAGIIYLVAGLALFALWIRGARRPAFHSVTASSSCGSQF